MVDEIGGDLAVPTADADAFDRGGPRKEGERNRRPRRSRGGGKRVPTRTDDESAGEANVSGEAETAQSSSAPTRTGSPALDQPDPAAASPPALRACIRALPRP